MAMLAEPRRKQRLGPNPRGKFFTEDEDNKGRNLLEKMGWKSGNGLGVQRQGIREPIKPKIQIDARGLGFDVKSDPWMEHMDGFAAVLQNLQQTYSAEKEDEEGAESKAEEERLELKKKSKSSKNRIHYEKFVKNKDLSNIKGKDWTCIFGKSEGPKKEDTEIKEASSESELCFANPILFEERQEVDVDATRSTTTVFRSQMDKMFVKSTLPEDQPTQDRNGLLEDTESNQQDDLEEGATKKKKKKKNRKKEEKTEEVEEAKEEEQEEKDEGGKKKKKNRKKEEEPEMEEESVKKKKKNRKKEDTEIKEASSEQCFTNPILFEERQEVDTTRSTIAAFRSQMAKMFVKSTLPEDQPTQDRNGLLEDKESNQQDGLEEGATKKKKKNKNRKKEEKTGEVEEAEEEKEKDEGAKKKKKNRKKEEEPEREEESVKKKKKRKKERAEEEQSREEEEKKVNSNEQKPQLTDEAVPSVPSGPSNVSFQGKSRSKRARIDYSAEDVLAAASQFKGSNLLQIPGYRTQSNKVF